MLLEVPTDHPRPPVQTHAGAHRFLAIPSSVVAALKDFCRREKATLFMACLAAFVSQLFAYTGQTDILVGTPVANRNRVEAENLIGFFANTLVLRTDLSRDPSFRTLVARVKETALGAYSHQDLPFDKLVEVLRPQRDFSRNPIFQVNFRMDTGTPAQLQLGDAVVRLLDIDVGTSKFDLALELRLTPTAMDGYYEYSTDLFDRSTVDGFVEDFQQLLGAALVQPDTPLSRLEAFHALERHRSGSTCRVSQ
jgi:non-ribosomal peptide synthetase component F